ncbi:phosphopantothenoylcysteine decarboxylase/phosphopantothenate/cysteine ligase [Emticicia oligotrophica DSM 17448]|uniref:Coenzyme A biosynthesis bifunctional protein CoaBC n=1 Tax=Emticicia oligotrophica (strain DSM 17448 / CIP 109782 / MTCC 6937 / GPTSA100-15) TaxID=929562 RepID=A0ABM5MXK4_EMTOG|nr:bifunctional phosphopantothenoylcysteine decarboxylase/phosphopantothenate--cysteine ligase CoaBC [Emticicia oligotrophica]AFK01877.1 phosphopantothenoylcysteine decarboxylase/phosphopantothenate/cysteine ligase [Emticicia oligotrophica DSM 17448]
MSLKNKKVILGVSGSIAAYKSALLVRLLVKEGAEVKVIMTEAAKDFITPLTLSTLSKKTVISSFTKGNTGEWNNHVELGLWADVMIIAPASANTLAKCAHGIADNLLIATYLSAKCKVFFAPAMDLDMYKHQSTLENLKKLESYGNQIINAEFGELASGLVGEGRLAEPEQIVHELSRYFAGIAILKGKKVLITAGPTQEPIDPVRFISNHSSGKMGFAIAEAFEMAGADVTLVSGPVAIPAPKGVKLEKVQSAQQMFEETTKYFAESEIIILSAAVADYTPLHVADKKIKKKEDVFNIELTKTTDIAATLGMQKKAGQIIVGFALETDNEFENAKGKLERKNFDFVVLNSLQDSGAGFRYDTNKIKIIDREGNIYDFELKSKKEVAQDIIATILQKL